jgi:hypothetical protein
VEIRLPTQSLFLAGESLEVDNLVKRARPIDGADPRSRALVPQATPAVTAASRAVTVPETTVDYEAAAAAYQPRGRTPADLYRQVSASDRPATSQRFVDVFA